MNRCRTSGRSGARTARRRGSAPRVRLRRCEPCRRRAASPARAALRNKPPAADNHWRSSEFLRIKQGDDQVDHYCDGQDPAKNVEPAHFGLRRVSQKYVSATVTATKPIIKAI